MADTEPLIKWLEDRADNCARIARTKVGADQQGWREDEHYFRQAIAELRTRRAAEEAHRRSAEGFEERAREWLELPSPPGVKATDPAWLEWATASLASLLASVHKAAMERAAGIAETCHIYQRGGTPAPRADIVDAIRHANNGKPK